VTACKKAKLKITDYRLHDARHTYAVTAIKAGAPFEVVAAQLGHGLTQIVVNVYERFKPSAEERRACERKPRVREQGHECDLAPVPSLYRLDTCALLVRLSTW
jgi:integrase